MKKEGRERSSLPRGRKKSGRELAFLALWRVEAQSAYGDIVLDELFEREQLSAGERALATELTLGVLRWQGKLDYYLSQVADRPLSKVERRARICLRLGAYQLLMLSRVSPVTAVNSSVNLAPESAKGFVNAVLRSLHRKKGELKEPETIADPVQRLALSFSHPAWLIERWIARHGPEFTAALCAANNERPPLALRVNRLRTDREAVLQLFREHDLPAQAGKWSPLCVILEESTAVVSLPGFAEGLFSVQDEASQLAALLLSPKPSDLVLDACAAPGTKSLALLELMQDQGQVVAVDLHAGRLKRMEAEAKRLGLTHFTPLVADATRPLPLPTDLRGRLFDRILVDAPCSGLGILRRRPEIKWRRRSEDLRTLAQLQTAIVKNVASLLAPGGALVYSTCTLTEEENEDVIAQLIKSDDFLLEEPAGDFPSLRPLVEKGMLRTWPHLTGSDGFTLARLRRRQK